MEIEVTLLVTKAIAEGLKANPAHVHECVREAEAGMNAEALKRRRLVSSTPRLHTISQSPISKQHLELTFRAHTRSI